MTTFETFLSQQDEEAWSATLTTLLRSIHEVDRNATQIWFAFYPISLFQALEHADDPEKLAQQLLMQGKYDLKDQIDSSHTFLYGHRYWREVKAAVQKHAREFSASETRSLSDQVLAVAEQVAKQAKVDRSLVTGITAVAFMTVRQAGLAVFEAAPGKIDFPVAERHHPSARADLELADPKGFWRFGFAGHTPFLPSTRSISRAEHSQQFTTFHAPLLDRPVTTCLERP